MKWEITGNWQADRAAGAMTVDALTQEAAERIATTRGLVVHACRPVREPPAMTPPFSDVAAALATHQQMEERRFASTPPSPTAHPFRGSELGVASLVLGLAALLLGCLPMIGLFAVPIGAFGFIIALVGLVMAMSGSYVRMKMIIAAMAVCALATALPLVILAIRLIHSAAAATHS